MSRARALANLGGVTSSATELNLLDGQTDIASQAELDAAAYNDNVIQTNIALLAFKTAVNGSLAKYNLQDQVIDEYTDATGIDAGNSSNQILFNGAIKKYHISLGGDSSGSYTDSNADVWAWNKFITNGNFTVPSAITADILVVAGGGAGGKGGNSGGGGGAGALIWSPNVSLTTSNSSASNGVFPVVVGGVISGTSSTGTAGTKGNNSTFDTSSSTAAIKIIAEGGGGGGAQTSVSAGTGGSSGGGAYNVYPTVVAVGTSSVTPSGATKYGNTGSTAMNGDSARAGSGGGAGGTGIDPVTASLAFYGGAGKQAFIALGGGSSSELLTQDFLTGTSSGVVESSVSNHRFLAGGGGGQGHLFNQNGGLGGGGDSSGNSLNTNLGTNTGSGGHGVSSHSNQSGGATYGGTGAAGIVIVRYPVSLSDLILQSTDTDAKTEADYADMVMLIEDVGGTQAVLNTDIKGFVSRDSGSTFIEGTLVDEGDWGTDKRILAFHDLPFTGASGTAMCYKITTHNQTESKDTAIHAASIGWR